MEFGSFRIPRHAVERFRQRVMRGRGLSWEQARYEFSQCLASASKKDLKAGMRRRTHYISLGCCAAVANEGAIVTVLPRVQCPLCDKTVFGERSLSRHFFLHHFAGVPPGSANQPPVNETPTKAENKPREPR